MNEIIRKLVSRLNYKNYTADFKMVHLQIDKEEELAEEISQ